MPQCGHSNDHVLVGEQYSVHIATSNKLPPPDGTFTFERLICTNTSLRNAYTYASARTCKAHVLAIVKVDHLCCHQLAAVFGSPYPAGLWVHITAIYTP